MDDFDDCDPHPMGGSLVNPVATTCE